MGSQVCKDPVTRDTHNLTKDDSADYAINRKSLFTSCRKYSVVAGAKTEEIGGVKAIMVMEHVNEKTGGNRSMETGKTHNLKAQRILVEAKDEIIFFTGAESISMKSSKNIIINGANIQVSGSENITIKRDKVSTNG